MILFTGQKALGHWYRALLLLTECWMRGETTSLLTSKYVRFENKSLAKRRTT
jgi:hypothetical protein